jgi:hypothetical protein
MSDLVKMRAEENEARSRVDSLLAIDGELNETQLTDLEAADVQVRELKTKIKAAEIRASAKAAIETPSYEFRLNPKKQQYRPRPSRREAILRGDV